MNQPRQALLALSATLLLAAAPAHAAPGDAAAAKALLMQGVAFDTVKGRGKVPAYAAFLKETLVKGGFAAADISIEPVGETANLHLVWKGRGKAAPLAITAHMDVVEADPKDWQRDPFTAIEEGGYIFGRGSEDNKFDLSMLVASMISLKAQGFRPGRDIHVFFSGDEETDGLTAPLQAKQAKAAGVALMLNTDGGGGTLNEAGTPVGYRISAAEKTYVDLKLAVTDPGGHSSRPTGSNAIARLANAAARIGGYRFKPQLDEITRASLAAEGAKRNDAIGKAMLAFVANPADAAAIAVLRADPASVGQIGTTCEPTMINGGHAPNALPQSATLIVNCRIFPGVTVETVRDELARIVNDPTVVFSFDLGWPSPPASPLRPDVMAAVAKAVSASRPGVTPVPSMSAGASDSVFYRALDIPSYAVGGIFSRDADKFSHGLNERIPVSAIAPALVHWRTLITELAK